MNRLVSVLRKKKEDTAITSINPPAPTSKKPVKKKVRTKQLTMNDTQFRMALMLFLQNKEAIGKLSGQNEEYKPKLVEYTKEKGAVDEKGHRMLRIGDMIAKVQISIHKVLNYDAVEKLVHVLKKKNTITKKEAKRIMSAQFTVTMSEDAFYAMQKEIENWGCVHQRSLVVDEDQLKLLVAEGKITMDKLDSLYTKEERSSFVPTKVKE